LNVKADSIAFSKPSAPVTQSGSVPSNHVYTPTVTPFASPASPFAISPK